MKCWLACVLSVGCGSSAAMPDGPAGGDAPSGDAIVGDGPGPTARAIFVIPMENQPSSAIYGNTTYAPYINGLLATAASASKFQDELPNLVSEPHYVWMEAGTNVFSDITFSNDNDASTAHSTASTAHLATQLTAAGRTWIAYQEGITSGTCPIATSGYYAPKHDPFVFFRDVSGSPVTSSTPGCAAHHKAYTDLAADLQSDRVPNYAFITPNLCDDMHGATGCPQGTGVNANIAAGDTWLKNQLPPILAYAQTHDSIVFIVWDEGDSSNLVPFLALGNRIKPGISAVTYTHSSLLKSVEELLGVPVLGTVAPANDFAAMFQPGMFP